MGAPHQGSGSAGEPDLTQRYRALMGVLQEGVLLQDADLHVLEANVAAEILFGTSEGALVGGPDPVRGAVDEDHRPIPPDATPAARALATGLTHSGQIIGVNPADTGPMRWFSVNAAPLVLPGAERPELVISTFCDVTERKALEVELTHLALHDGLTGLANRTLLVDRVGHAMARFIRRSPDPTIGVSVLFIDIDGFQSINDALGNRVGDEILRILAQRLRSAVREEDTVARVGGDEFVVLCDEMNRTDLARFCVRVTQVFSQPVISRVGDEWRSVAIGCTAGVAMARPGEDADKFLQRVDKMLKEQSHASSAVETAGGVRSSSTELRPGPARPGATGTHHRRKH